MNEKTTENRKSAKIVVDDLEIIVRGNKEKPYYEIMYHEVGKEPRDYDLGFGSYMLEYVLQWKEEYFEVVQKEDDKTENKVTNEQLLEHIAELEEAMSLMTNSMSLIFNIMLRNKDKIEFDESTVKHGRLAMTMETQSLVNKYTEIKDAKRKEGMSEEERDKIDEISDELIDMLTDIIS